MIPNEPVVAAIGVVITVLTVLSIGVVNELVVAVVAVEAVGVVLVVDTDIVTEDSDAVLNVVGIIVLSAKHTTIDRQPYPRWSLSDLYFRTALYRIWQIHKLVDIMSSRTL